MKTRQQYAALPYMIIGKQVHVLLITRRRSGRWIIPKGWPETDMSAPELAALEAYEEAGLKGRIGKKPIGSFSYAKQLEDSSKVTCEVTVYALCVNIQYLEWPEKGQRQLRWMKKKKVGEFVEEKDLAALIEQFDPLQDTKAQKTKTKRKGKSAATSKTKSKASSKNNDKGKGKNKSRNKSKLKPGIRASY